MTFKKISQVCSIPAPIAVFLAIFLTGCQAGKKIADGDAEKIPFTTADLKAAQKVIGLSFTDNEIDTLYGTVARNLDGYQGLRQTPLENAVAPALVFDPRPAGFNMAEVPAAGTAEWGLPEEVTLPDNKEELAFYSVAELSVLIRTRKITSVELTGIYLERIRRYDARLEAVITLTDSLALVQARRADAEIAAGKYRGPLHGIPYGVKDLASVKGYPTTWGAQPFKNQQFDFTATVVEKLEAAGAVLVAKLVSGELATGDIWFAGQTKNPWDLQQGASGSSAGSGSATAAGLVAFSIGTETWGSILSPSSQCGATGLRPTFGRVSRYGVMTLAWSLDKVGPICRTAQDCALVLNAIKGRDEKDRSTIDAGFVYDADLDLKTLRVGFLEEEFSKETGKWGENANQALATFRSMGIEPEPMTLPGGASVYALMSTIIRAEAGAAFDDLVLSNQDDDLARQTRWSRANSLRQARFIPAVEYIQANRYRDQLINEMKAVFDRYDAVIVPTNTGNQSALSNLTGHPAICLPNGWDDKGRPTSISLLGGLYRENILLAIGARFQALTDFESRHPAGF